MLALPRSPEHQKKAEEIATGGKLPALRRSERAIVFGERALFVGKHTKRGADQLREL